MAVTVRSPRERGKLKRRSSAKKRTTGSTANPPSPKKPASPSKAGAASRQQVRVWWPPTKDKKRSDLSGMFWPARVVEDQGAQVKVMYDNGESESVSPENVQPAETSFPTRFGMESRALVAGEYCEVFNNSRTDPAVWFARIKEASKATYVVEYPFHDDTMGAERKASSLVRRSQVHIPKKGWFFIDPRLKWESRRLASPMECDLINKSELDAWLSSLHETKAEPKPRQAKGAAPKRSVAKAGPIKKRSKHGNGSTEVGQGVVPMRLPLAPAEAHKISAMHARMPAAAFPAMAGGLGMPIFRLPMAGTMVPPPGTMPPGAMPSHLPVPSHLQRPPQFVPGMQPLMSPIQHMDLDVLKRQVKRLAHEDAYYLILDALRPQPDDPGFHMRCNAAHAFLLEPVSTQGRSTGFRLKKRSGIKDFLTAMVGDRGFQELASRKAQPTK